MQHAHARMLPFFPSYVRTAEQVQSPTTQTDAVTMDAQLLPPSAIAERVMWLPRDAIFSPTEQPLVLRHRTHAPRRYELSPALLAAAWEGCSSLAPGGRPALGGPPLTLLALRPNR